MNERIVQCVIRIIMRRRIEHDMINEVIMIMKSIRRPTL